LAQNEKAAAKPPHSTSAILPNKEYTKKRTEFQE